ncbi:MAG: hypothetical protein NZL83_00615 [Candidatus Absconditabacterales bacterium]|nr:hypothetical protein [Candidatus Absconditabacterales bacterium]
MSVYHASCPSNIALVKYWGKKPGYKQIPANPSVSLTLTMSRTMMTWYMNPKHDDIPIRQCFFHGKEHQYFGQKIASYCAGLADVLPGLDQRDIVVQSENTFPHSAGIASSASAFATMALCLGQWYRDQGHTLPLGYRTWDQFHSMLARRGSGSACRSVYSGLVTRGWESVDFASPVDVHHVSRTYDTIYDTIIVISSDEKKQTSTAGHASMDTNPYASIRYEQARRHTEEILRGFEEGSWLLIGSIIEQECWELHAMMLLSQPSTIHRLPETLRCIQVIKEWRDQTGEEVFITIDAGANIHCLSLQPLSPQLRQRLHFPLIEDWSVLRPDTRDVL